MKKLIALMLCLAMALSFTAAFAETTPKGNIEETPVDGRFTVRWFLPEGYYSQSVNIDYTAGSLITALMPEDTEAGKPMMLVSIAADELLSEVQRLNDLDDDALAQIEATFREEDQVEITYMETAHGTKLMVVKETLDGVDYVDFYTIYLGYEIELVLTQTQENAGVSITDEQIATVIQFLSDMEFFPAE